MYYATEFQEGMFAALRFAGHWVFRGPWSSDIVDNIIVQTLIYSGPYGGVDGVIA